MKHVKRGENRRKRGGGRGRDQAGDEAGTVKNRRGGWCRPRNPRARGERRGRPRRLSLSGRADEHIARHSCSKGVTRTKAWRPSGRLGCGAEAVFASGHTWPQAGPGSGGVRWPRGGRPEGPHRALLRSVQCHRRVWLAQPANTASLIFPTSDDSLSGWQVKQPNSWRWGH